MKKISFGLAAALLATTAFAHGDHDPTQGHQKPPPFAIVQLDAGARCNREIHRRRGGGSGGVSRHRIVRAPHGMALHEGRAGRRKIRSDASPNCWCTPTIPAAASASWSRWNTPCRSSLSKRAPVGFVGHADEWDANQDFQLWTLHAWVFEFNQDGVFAPFNPRVNP